MEEMILNITVKLRGTKTEMERIRARFAVLSSCEEVQCLFIREAEKVAGIWELKRR